MTFSTMEPFKFLLFLSLLLVHVAAQTIYLKFSGNGTLSLFVELSAPADQTYEEKERNTDSKDPGIGTLSTLIQILISAATLGVLMHYLINKYVEEIDNGVLAGADMECMNCEDMLTSQEVYYDGSDDMEEMVSFEDVDVEPAIFMTTATIVFQ